jgi:beta-barrel assembly-enhancing protease
MLLAFLIAAAPPQLDTASFRALVEADSRLVTIGRRLAKGGAGLCGGAVSNPGWTIEDTEQFPPALRAPVRVGLGLGTYPTVAAVEAGSAAALGGARIGDEVTRLDGRALPVAPSRKATRTRQDLMEKAFAAGLSKGWVTAEVRRGGRLAPLRIVAEPGCATDFVIGRARGLRAAASDGMRVTVSPQIIEFARSDDELALVLSHELAHNLLGHNPGGPAQRIAGQDRSGARRRDREREADRWALYLMARGGFDIAAAPGFWRRWGPKTGFGILSDGSHPDWRERAGLAEVEIARIRAQQAAGQALIP